MTTLIKNLGTALSNAVLFAAAIVMAVLGFALVGMLALFGLMAIGVAMIAIPFAPKPSAADADATA